ncbi:hypothetical protein GCM10009566_51700 [Streptomyces murinus]
MLVMGVLVVGVLVVGGRVPVIGVRVVGVGVPVMTGLASGARARRLGRVSRSSVARHRG